MLCCFGNNSSSLKTVNPAKSGDLSEEEKDHGKTNSKFSWFFSQMPTSIHFFTSPPKPQGTSCDEIKNSKKNAVTDKLANDRPSQISATITTPGEPISQTKESLLREKKVNENLERLINFAYKPIKPTFWQRLQNFFRWLFCLPPISLGQDRVGLTPLENEVIDDVIQIGDNSAKDKYIRLDKFNGIIDKYCLDLSLQNIPQNDIASIITIISGNQQYNQICSGVVTSVLSDEPYNAIKPKSSDKDSCSIILININEVTDTEYIINVKSLDANLVTGSVLAVHAQLAINKEELRIRQEIKTNKLFVASEVKIREIVIKNLIDTKNNGKLHEKFKYMRITENMDDLDPNNQLEKEILNRISELTKETLGNSRRDNESIKKQYSESKNKENSENIQKDSLQLEADNNGQTKSSTQKGYFDKKRSFKIYFKLGAAANINLNQNALSKNV